MARAKIKNIDSLAQELKNKLNGCDDGLKIGIVVYCSNLEDNYSLSLAKTVKKQVIKNGAEAEIINLPNLNERFRTFNNSNYVLSSFKNQISNFLELVLFDKNLDGVVFIDGGFNTTLGSLIASIRLNIPTLVLPIGVSSQKEGQNLQDVLSLPGQIANNQKSVFDQDELIETFSEIVGSGTTFNSQNLFNIILEAMELAPKNSATALSQSFEMDAQAKLCGENIVTITKNRLPLKKLINRKSINNALLLNYCLGGNPSIINALFELASAADLELDMGKILASSKNVPVLFNTYKGIQNYCECGGTWTLIKAMIKNKIIDGNYKTFADSTLSDETKHIKNYEAFATPLKKESLIVLRGNVAEKWALTKTINLPEEKTKVISNIQVFSSDEEACNAVINKAVTQNSVIVIKDCGKNAQTGFSSIAQTAMALKSMDQQANHVILTDGFVEEDIDVVAISCVYPDSESGNIKYLKDGDEIEIDFVKGKINVEVGNREFVLRQKKYVQEHKILPKYLK